MEKVIQNHPFQNVFQNAYENVLKMLFGKT